MEKQLKEDKNQTRGEFVIVIDGYQGNENESLSNAYKMAAALLEYLPASQAARVAAKLNDVPRRKVYQLIESNP